MTGSAWLAAAQLPVRSAQGLDVSNFQGAFPWSQQSGLSFGIYRLTQGLSTAGTNSPDPTAQHNHDGIKALGIRHGAYHFLDPFEDGTAQAALFIAAHKRIGLDETDMLWLDNENARNPGPAQTAGCARAFMAELDKLCPRNPRGVYTFISYATTGHCAGLGKYPLWLAFPASTAPQPPPPWAHWTFWQWGARKGVDADAFNGTAADLDAWIRSFGPAPLPQRKHNADGATSLREWAHRPPRPVQVQDVIHAMALAKPHGFGPMQAQYITQGDWDLPMPEGMDLP